LRLDALTPLNLAYSCYATSEDEAQSRLLVSTAGGGTLKLMARTKKPTSTAKRTIAAKPASRANGRSASNGIGPIRNKARREKIEALIKRTTKGPGPTPEMEARLKDDAWGKRIVDP
jgi:hypothetical protein